MPNRNASWLVNVVGHELGLRTFIQDLKSDGNYFDLISPGIQALICMLIGSMSVMWLDPFSRAGLERKHLQQKDFRFFKKPMNEEDFGKSFAMILETPYIYV